MQKEIKKVLILRLSALGDTIHTLPVAYAIKKTYPEAGGKNVSGLHWDLIKNMKNGGEIYADDILIYKDGKFVI